MRRPQRNARASLAAAVDRVVSKLSPASRRPGRVAIAEQLERRVFLSGTATFVRADVNTQGNWGAVYGANGYQVFDGPTSLPAYAQVSTADASSGAWITSTTDVRALEDAPWYNAPTSNRTAGYLVSTAGGTLSSFSIDVHLTDANTHEVALYLLDWDGQGRAETVQAADTATGTALDTQSVSNFTGGTYLVWNLSGDVTLTVTGTAGLNPVASGLFFAPPATAPTGPAAAAFVASDTATQGNWSGVYGSQGYDLLDASSSLPAYAQLSALGEQGYVWDPNATALNAPQNPVTGGRTASCYYAGTSFGLDLNLDFSDGQTHQIGLYLVDYDGQGRSETVQVSDAYTGAVLDTQAVSNFGNGIYLLWDVSGDVRMTITCDSGLNAVASGVFFDPPADISGTPANVNVSGTTASSVSLTWNPVPGAAGYTVLRQGPDGSASFPAASASYTDTSVASDTVYTYQVESTDSSGNASSPSAAVTAMTLADPAAGYNTLWDSSQSPSAGDSFSPQATSGLELGVQFNADEGGYITGIQFFKGPQNTGAHIGDLWTSSGVLLASATFTNESQSGWQEVDFSTPVMITGGQSYTASYFGTSGHFALSQEYFASAGTNSGLLHAPSGSNGIFEFGPSAFPNQVYNATNYWVQPIFAQPVYAPPSLSITNTTATDVSLAWGAASGASGYVVLRQGPGDSSFVPIAATTTITGFDDTDVLPQSVYSYEVTANGAGGQTATAGPVSTTTLAQPVSVSAVGQDDLCYEGTAFTVSLAYNSTAGLSAQQWLIDWGDGSTTPYGAAFGNTGQSTHVYNDAGNYVITVTVSDGSESLSTTADAQILDVIPSLSITGEFYTSESNDEGSSYVISDTYTDAPSDSVSEFNVDWGDGCSFSSDADPGSAGHNYSEAGDYTITATATNDDGDEASSTWDIVVYGTPPTITASGDGSVEEGSSYTLTTTFSDPAGSDTPSGWEVDWGDGHTADYGGDATSFTHVYSEPGDYTIVATVQDDDGPLDNAVNSHTFGFQASQVVNVTEADPSLVVSGPGDSIAQGDTATFTATFSDPGGDTVDNWVVDFGDGTGDQLQTGAASSITVTHSYSNGGTDYGITVVAENKDGPVDGGTSVYVEAPSTSSSSDTDDAIQFNGEGTPVEGSAYTVDISATDGDDGASDSSGCDCSSGSDGSSGCDGCSGSDGCGSDGCGSDGCGSDGCGSDGCGSDGCGSDGCGSDGCGSDGCGSDGCGADGCGSDGCGSDGCGSDGSSGCDCSCCDSSGSTYGDDYTIDWGDGSSDDVNGTNDGSGDFSGSAIHTYQEEGTYEIVVSDDDGYSVSEFTQVEDQPATMSDASPQSVEVGCSVTTSTTFSDAGSDEHDQAWIDWGDGRGLQPAAISGNTISAATTYSQPGSYAGTFVLATGDDEPVSASVPITVTLPQITGLTISDNADSTDYDTLSPNTQSNAPLDLAQTSVTSAGDPVMKLHATFSDENPIVDKLAQWKLTDDQGNVEATGDFENGDPVVTINPTDVSQQWFLTAGFQVNSESSGELQAALGGASNFLTAVITRATVKFGEVKRTYQGSSFPGGFDDGVATGAGTKWLSVPANGTNLVAVYVTPALAAYFIGFGDKAGSAIDGGMSGNPRPYQTAANGPAIGEVFAETIKGVAASPNAVITAHLKGPNGSLQAKALDTVHIDVLTPKTLSVAAWAITAINGQFPVTAPNGPALIDYLNLVYGVQAAVTFTLATGQVRATQIQYGATTNGVMVNPKNAAKSPLIDFDKIDQFGPILNGGGQRKLYFIPKMEALVGNVAEAPGWAEDFPGDAAVVQTYDPANVKPYSPSVVYYVSAHEMGHLLNLNHMNIKNYLMSADLVSNPTLYPLLSKADWDIANANAK